MEGGYDNPRSARPRASDNDRVVRQWGQPELCRGLRLPPMGTTGERVFAPTYEEASARIQGLKRGGSRFSKLGGLENHSKGTGRCVVLAAGLPGSAVFQVTPGEGGPGSSRPATRERRRPGA
ncbi:hypothetical protein NicSoilB8_47050 (plasmid) [Arthrobacter sp. NicSoilB8]|nr:hypothetical protein NicSoilB8_47050 [Arthrobacter sp. NicSoilB8]